MRPNCRLTARRIRRTTMFTIEMILVREGTMEVTIAGRSAKLGPGSVGYVASNEQHGWRNVGTRRAHYFVPAIGRD
jgi:quercetin dioxygenase-like cupin family protein